MSSLENILKQAPPTDFPFDLKDDYINRYNQAVKILKPIQSSAEKGALLKDAISKEDLRYLNNHGPEHIECVCRKCYEISVSNGYPLNGYEAYILLIAINVHDVGNIHGREGHERKALEVINNTLGDVLGSDTPEKRLIAKIATVHGGKVNGSKDTIKSLENQTYMLNKTLSPRFLAALLRFSDELADDSSRASKYELRQNLIPENSKIFHCYSESLHTVKVDRGAVYLKYHLTSEIAQEEFNYKDGKIFLLDEIYRRLVKMHVERHYCMIFMRPKIDISKIFFEIEIDHPIDYLLTSFRCADSIEDTGYPEDSDIFLLCPQLKGKDGASILASINAIT